MTFLNPYALFALVAASFPVLFHLFAQRRARRVEFSSIRFLKQLEKSSMRKVKIRQLLLLILRTLLIACLVLAFSRPALRGTMGSFLGASHANTTAILLFDNSASMMRANTSGTYIKQAQDAAIKISDALEDGDELIIVPIASIENGKQYRRLHDRQEIRKAITDLSATDAPAQLDNALHVASAELARSANVNKEVYLISDNQADNLKTLPAGDSTLKLFDEKTVFFPITISAGAPSRNLSIDSLKTITTVFEQGRSVEFSATIRNTGESAVENAVVSLFYNDERVTQQTIASIASGKTETVTLSAVPKTTGILAVRTELEEDALAFDNKRYLTLDLPAAEHIALFSNSPGDGQYIALALEQSLSENGTSSYIVEEHRLEELRMLPSLRSRLDGVFIEIGSTAITAADLTALKEYISAGGTVVLFPLADITPSDFTAIAAPLSLPALQSVEGSLNTGAAYSSIASFDLAHPFFRGMFDENSLPNTRGIESPKIYRHYKFTQSGTSLIKLSDGSPLLSEIKVGKGTVLLYSIPPNFSYSDLPRKPIFLPLIRRSAAYLSSLSSGKQLAVASYTTGEPADLILPVTASVQTGERLLVKGPNAQAVRIEVKGTANGGKHIQLDQTPFAGIYSIFKDAESKEPIVSYAINGSTLESNTTSASAADLQTAIKKTGIAPANYHPIATTEKDLTTFIKQSRFGVELWQIALAIAIACAIAEMLIAREAKEPAAS